MEGFNHTAREYTVQCNRQ